MRAIRLLPLLVGLVLLETEADGGTPPATGSITGFTFDHTGVPLRGVKVQARLATDNRVEKTAYSQQDGRFTLTPLPVGRFAVTARAPKLITVIPARVGAYRLLGYENRLMPKEDFNDDRKDGGEIGSGHTVTALYEVVPAGPAAARALSATGSVDPLRHAGPLASNSSSSDLLTVKVRYKDPKGEISQKREWPLSDPGSQLRPPSTDFRFAAAVAAFGLVMRASDHRGRASLTLARQLASDALGSDPDGHRRGFFDLLALAERVQGHQAAAGSLSIRRTGRADIRLQVAGRQMHGRVGGQPFQVEVKPAELVGHIGGEPLWMWLHGREAEGSIGGHQVAFILIETPTGHLLRGTAVGHTVRMEESHGRLSWLPSCERSLLRLPAGPAPMSSTVYQGACASGQRMQLSLPDALDDWPPLPRMILLALLLTEEDELVAAGRGGRRLFSTEGSR